MQFTPQFLYYQELLKLVDWETIVVYTCANEKCLPNFASDEYYVEEYAYIQFTEDFAKV